MAPRQNRNNDDPPEFEHLRLSNVSGKGLGYYDKDSRLIMASSVSLKLIGTTFCPTYAIKANVWAAKYHEANEGSKTFRLVVPKCFEKDHNKFEAYIDKQSGEDSGFRIRKPSLWKGFVQHQEDLLHEQNRRVKFTLAENTGLLDNIVKTGDRTTERYIFSANMMLNSQGKKLESVDVVFHPTLSLKLNAMPLLKSISLKSGGRDVFASVIRVSTPGDNFYPCQLALAGSFTLFHGNLVRKKITGGQLPAMCLKSLNRGKSQGKSSTGRLIMKCTSCWSKNKLSYNLAMETIKKRASFTSLPLYFDDVKSDKFLVKITEGFDDGEVYETKEGEFVRRSEIIFSANYYGFDDVAKSNLDGEQIGDRISAIPFEEMIDINPAEFAMKQRQFKAVVDAEEKPTELLIGEIGDYLLSEEILEKKDEFAHLLLEKCEETIKIRTLGTCYATFYCVLYKLFTIFEDVWAEKGYTWEGMMAWMERVHIPFMKRQHQEKDHAKHSIRRYVTDLFNFTLDWSIVERRKLLKICETTKIRSGEKYCLAFHPSQSYQDIQEMGGVRLKDLKDHTNSVGGSWGRDTWACLVSDEVDIDFEQTGVESGLDDTKSKRAILIPISVFPSAQIMRICDLLGQNDDYRRFGADEETPSGVESLSGEGMMMRNSTQMPGSQAISLNMSSINHPAPAEDDIDFDTLAPPNESFFEEEANEASDDGQNEIDDVVEEIDARSSKQSFSKNLKSSNNRTITEVTALNKTNFVCNCGYSSANKSATSRHKCRNGGSVLFKCLECPKICSNPGSLKRHGNAKHKNITISADVNYDIQNESNEVSSEGIAKDQVENVGKTCDICNKSLKNETTLKRHLATVHKNVDQSQTQNMVGAAGKNGGLSNSRIRSILSSTELSQTSSIEASSIEASNTQASQDKNFQCSVCQKTLKSKKNLERHLLLVHKQDLVSSTPPANSESLVDNSPVEVENNDASKNQERGLRTGGRRRSLSLMRHKGRRK